MLHFEYAICATQGAREYQEDTALAHSFERGVRVSVPAADGNGLGRAEAASSGFAPGPDHDACEEGDALLIAVLADGMGGHTGGALASRTVCETFLSALHACDDNLKTHLTAALDRANGALAEKVAADPVLSGMGSTLVGVVFSDDGVDWVSVGDSPLLLYRRGEIAILNEDHSLAPELDRLAQAGFMTPEEAMRDPRRHMLRSAVTGDDLELVDVSRISLQLEAGDYVILASDGVHTLECSELERIVAAYADDGAEAVACALIRAVEAVRDPHQDNATVIAVRPMGLPAVADDSLLQNADNSASQGLT